MTVDSPTLSALTVDEAVRSGTLFADGRRMALGHGAVRTVEVAAGEAGSVIRRAVGDGAPGALFTAAFDPDQPTLVLIPDELAVARADGPLEDTGAEASAATTIEMITSASAQAWALAVAEASAAVRNPASPLEKVVLAREIRVRADAAFDPRAVLGRLARMFPTAMLYAIGDLVGASPELLGEVFDGHFRARALAGTLGREADPARDDAARRSLLDSDKDRQEHSLLRTFLAQRLAPVVDDLTYNVEPHLLTLPNVHHLMTTFDGRPAPGWSGPGGLVDIVSSVHPTPAVAGVPQRQALAWIRDHEPPRGRLHGFAGWTDREGNGQAALVLRSLQLSGAEARLVVGNGIVGESDPAAEVLELQAKARGILDAVTSL